MQNFMLSKKKLNLGQKLPYLGIFGLELEKTFLIFKIKTVDFIKNEFLTNIINFGIRSAFCKGPEGSSFLNIWVRGPGLICKVVA